MKIRQHQLLGETWHTSVDNPDMSNDKVGLVLVFGGTTQVSDPAVYPYLKGLYKNADIVFSSTSGEILGKQVYDNSVAATAVEFEKTKIKSVSICLDETKSSFDTGHALMEKLAAEDLCNVFVISDGLLINGSELVAGFNSANDRKVPVTGGLAGDGDRFVHTFTGLNEQPKSGVITAVGFYGNHLAVGPDTFGGWDEFGHERVITKSDKNVLFEIDGKSALNLYKTYLGDYTNELPGSALLFPLSLKKVGAEVPVVRTILAVNEQESSMTFAGNMPEGSRVRFMKANFTNLISGSSNAAQFSSNGLAGHAPSLAILVSCVGRKLILNQRTEEEVEAASNIFGSEVAVTGFYSYGEISPLNGETKCELHNQTMTITTLAEI